MGRRTRDTESVVRSFDFMSIIVTVSYPNTEDRQPFWRVKHDIEMGGVWRAGMPEVHTLYLNQNPTHSDHFSRFQKWAQLISRQMNPSLDDELWTKVYWTNYWIANGQGYGMPDDPRANFVTGENLSKPLPKVESLTCGGSLIEGIRDGDWVKVRGLHFNTSVSLDYLKAHPEYWTRGVAASGTGNPYRMLGHKYEGEAIIHPLIINNQYECWIQAYKLQPWTSPEPPDPLKIYL